MGLSYGGLSKQLYLIPMPQANITFLKTFWPISSFLLLFVLFVLMYLAASGLSDSLQTLSCGLWDLVPWPGIEPLVEHILIQENIAEKMKISYNPIRLRESLLKLTVFKGWHLFVYLPNKTEVNPYLAFVQCDFHSGL